MRHVQIIETIPHADEGSLPVCMRDTYERVCVYYKNAEPYDITRVVRGDGYNKDLTATQLKRLQKLVHEGRGYRGKK